MTFKKMLAFTSYEGGLMKCLACDKVIESCRCVWSAVRELQENIRKCVHFELVHSNERSNELFHKAILEAHNNLQAQVDSFGLILVRLERQIEYGLPSVGKLNKMVKEQLDNVDNHACDAKNYLDTQAECEKQNIEWEVNAKFWYNQATVMRELVEKLQENIKIINEQNLSRLDEIKELKKKLKEFEVYTNQGCQL